MNPLTADPSDWRVLVVDDRADNLKLLVKTLEHFKAAVLALSDSREVIPNILLFRPNVILLDLAMPHLSGWSLFTLLKQQDISAKIPIVAVSALAMPADLERAKTLGFNGYITKPYTVDGVMTSLKTIIGEFVRSVSKTEQTNVDTTVAASESSTSEVLSEAVKPLKKRAKAAIKSPLFASNNIVSDK